MRDRELLLREAVRQRADGAADDAIVAWLGHQPDTSVIDAIYVTRLALDVSLGEAKRIVTTHPEWSQRADMASVIQDDAVRALDEFESGARDRQGD
ncbi:MAG: hypothetical protein K8T90_08755 [Planctomycetes bacterium]|nr:hypothetical protein [Planctomycetota bacterium]